MFRKLFAMGILLALAAGLSAQQPAGEEEPLRLSSYRCEDHLRVVADQDGRSEIVLIWAHGYWSALNGVDESSDTITTDSVEQFRTRLLESCRENPEQLFITAVKKLKLEGE